MDLTLYQKVADQIETYIHEGLFKLGERILSVRKASAQPSSEQSKSIQALLSKLLYLSQNPKATQFGAAIPNNQFLPVRQLQRSVGRLIRLQADICVAKTSTSSRMQSKHTSLAEQAVLHPKAALSFESLCLIKSIH